MPLIFNALCEPSYFYVRQSTQREESDQAEIQENGSENGQRIREWE